MNIKPFIFALLITFLHINANEKMYGYNKDVRFANMLWRTMLEKKLVGQHSIATQPYRGLPPHGLYVERIETKLQIGRTRGNVIILKNYISKNLDIMNIINHPSQSLSNISVMFKRRNSYDGDHKNWFYVQYSPNGAIMQGNNGFRLAGKIMNNDNSRGCISCHMNAPNGDYIFSHDKLAYMKGDNLYKIKQNPKKMQVTIMPTKDPQNAMNKKVQFGNKEDIAYAKKLWYKMQKKGFNSIPSNLYMGPPPHGAIREVVEGNIDGKRVIVKRNYGGDGATLKLVEKSREKYLQSITVMAKREAGFDPDNANWFWVKYDKNGYLMRNKKYIKLAGKIAKGMPEGCIACHTSAENKDLVFKHNKMINADIVFIKDMVQDNTKIKKITTYEEKNKMEKK